MSLARVVNSHAIRDDDLFQELPNSANVLPSAANVEFPQDPGELRRFTRASCVNLLSHYGLHSPARATVDVLRKRLQIYIGAPPFTSD